MLATGRGLMSRPTLLLLDEPSMGLSPIMVEEIFRIIKEINSQGTSILLVEQNARAALQVSDYGYVLETGEIARQASGAVLVSMEDTVVLVDEAYHHFVEDPNYGTSVPYVLEGRPVIVARTFSKIAALAGKTLITRVRLRLPKPWRPVLGYLELERRIARLARILSVKLANELTAFGVGKTREIEPADRHLLAEMG